MAQLDVANGVLGHGVVQMQNLQLLLLLDNNVDNTAVHIELIAIVDNKINLGSEHDNAQLICSKGYLQL